MHKLFGDKTKYAKHHILGQGAQGKAYLVERTTDNEKFVLKINTNESANYLSGIVPEG